MSARACPVHGPYPDGPGFCCPALAPVEEVHAAAAGALCRDAGDGCCADCGASLLDPCGSCGGAGCCQPGCPEVDCAHEWREVADRFDGGMDRVACHLCGASEPTRLARRIMDAEGGGE